MKKIKDNNKIQAFQKQFQIKELFTHMPEMELFIFEKEELLNRKLNPKDYFLFLVEGNISISNIRADGSLYEIPHIQAFTCLGDMEFIQPNQKQFTICAKTNCTVLAIDLQRSYEELSEDCIFLRYLLKSITDKFQSSMVIHSENMTLESKVLSFIQKHEKITHVEECANELCCSRRQLQRVLKKLVNKKKIVHPHRGLYLKNGR